MLLEKYVKDTNYKVRIKTIINDSSSEWSETKEFKTDESLVKYKIFNYFS